MTTGEVLNKVNNLTKDILYYWEAKGYVKPRKYQRGRVDKRDYSERDLLLITTIFKYYEKGFPPKKSYEKAIEEISKERKGEMGKFGWMVIITLVFSLSLLGCEKLPEWLKFGRPKEVEVVEFPPRVEEGEVLARINDRVITLEEFNQRIEALPEELKDIYLKDLEAKSAFLDELINRELLIKEAIDRRLDYEEGVARLITAFKDQILFETIIARESEKVKVASAEVESFFNVYKDRFVVPEERKVRTIVLATDEEAKSVLIELLKGADFAALAKEKSVGPAREKGGDIGFIVRKTAFTPPDKKTMFPQFEQAAFSLDLGRVSSIVKGPDGYYIIKLEKKKEAKERTLYEVWDDLEKEILVMKQGQVIAKLVDNLRKKAKVEVREELLEAK